jgi:hypothetical protein
MQHRMPKDNANRIQIAGCYLFWWFTRRRSNVSDFDTQVKDYFAKSQFYTSLVLPVLLAVCWIEFKAFKVLPNSLSVIYIITAVLMIFVVEATILSHSKILIRHFESIENRFKFDLLVMAYLTSVLALIVLTAFLFPHRGA